MLPTIRPMTHRGPVSLILVALLGVAAAPAPSTTTTTQPRDTRIRELEAAIGEASAEEATALRELVTIRERRSELDASIGGLARQVADVSGAITAHQAEVDRLVAALVEIDGRITETTDQLDDAQDRAEQSAADLYLNESGGVPVRVGVLEADSVRDVIVGSVYLANISNDHWAEVDELAGLKDVIEQLEAMAQTQQAEEEAARAEAERRREELDQLRAQQRVERDEVASQESRERALVEEIRERKDEYTAELAALQASSNAITEMLAVRQKGQTRATTFTVARPVPGAVSSSFGARVHPIYGDSRMHNGVDMTAGHGAPIKAGAAGVVAFAGVRQGYGYTVIIDHGNQYATLYAHASSLEVTTGRRVEKGQTVALVGATGLAAGPHLHFEVRLLGAPVNPLNYL